MTNGQIKQLEKEHAEELLKKLHTAMCNDNEHQCNRLNNYIHTDEYLTAEVVQVVNEIIAEETKELREQNKELTLKISRLESDCDAYDYSQRTYQEEIKELKAENEQIKNSDTLCKLIGEQKRKITELEAQIEKMKCCYNCKHSRTDYVHCITDKHENWEMIENV